MTHAIIYHHLKKSGLLQAGPLTELEIKPLAGGTNHVFLITQNKQQYVIKIPKAEAHGLIDRETEYHAAQITAAAGINLPFCYFDLDSGVNITAYQPHNQILTPALLQEEFYWQTCAQLLKKLHHLPQKFLRDIHIFSVLDFYKSKAAGKIPEDLADILAWDNRINALRQEFSSLPIPACPCHGDPILSNFLLTNSRIYLIDWEYAGNNDPCWDLASFAVEAEFTSAQEQQFLTYYFQNSISDADERRYQVYKVLSNYLWTLWSIVMSDIDNAKRRFQKFKEAIEYLC